jgi:hypothetical protein
MSTPIQLSVITSSLNMVALLLFILLSFYVHAHVHTHTQLCKIGTLYIWHTMQQENGIKGPSSHPPLDSSFSFGHQ